MADDGGAWVAGRCDGAAFKHLQHRKKSCAHGHNRWPAGWLVASMRGWPSDTIWLAGWLAG
eukprot:198415-Chlamydomonas_euryale.AAC.1